MKKFAEIDPFFRVERNDVEGALQVIEKLIDEERWTPDWAEIAYMLQDDPDRLAGRVRALMKKKGLDPERSPA